jgi:ferredoxin-nitrite reductase
MVEGYDLHVGGGAGAEQRIGRLVRRGVVFADLGPMALALLRRWMDDRAPGESFQSFTARLSSQALAAICDG